VPGPRAPIATPSVPGERVAGLPRDAVLVLLAHPYPGRSRACDALVRAVRDLPRLEIRSLYDRYPDFDVDPKAEQAALESADLVVWLAPMHWYGVPGLLKHWFDVVLVKGWAYGDDATALVGKDVLWAVTTGGDEDAFSAGGRHGLPLEAFVPAIERTARFCGMGWLAPHVLHGAHRVDDEALARSGEALRARLIAWRAGRGA
jgi:glutathione-regulated potassium-efflux system ancillary protein KefF